MTSAFPHVAGGNAQKYQMRSQPLDAADVSAGLRREFYKTVKAYILENKRLLLWWPAEIMDNESTMFSTL